MSKYFLAFLLFLTINPTQAADYIVYFVDKNGTAYSLAQPGQFLSQRALDRRDRQMIAIDSTDLPVSAIYVDSLRALGLNVHGVSKWLNAAHLRGDSALIVNTIAPLDFIVGDERLARKQKYESLEGCDEEVDDTIIYGQNKTQVYQLNGQFLHNQGFRGEGMQVAVIDGGFTGSRTNRAFDHIYDEDRLLAVYDFTFNDTSIFGQSTHGNNVFSIIGGVIDSQYFGTSPKADFLLLKSEYVSTETMSEEFDLARALEYADSAGTDVINISLGYFTFDDNIGDHTWEELDGNTAISTIAADKAASKGMIVVNSAGNEGTGSWKYIGFPADADSVLAIAAVDSNGNVANFSSYGRSEDPRVKPGVAAMGVQTVYVNSNGNISRGNGTSYAAPVITGLITCLWQAFPDKNNMEIIDAVQRSSSQYFAPDDRKGYGIPDFANAYAILANASSVAENTIQTLGIYPNPCRDRVVLQLPDAGINKAEVQIFDILGKMLYSGPLEVSGRKTVNFDWPAAILEHKGIFVLRLNTNKLQYTSKVIKW